MSLHGCRLSGLLLVLSLMTFHAELRAQDAAATRQYAAAVALQNRGEYELAADEWNKLITNHKNDPRVDRALHYLGICHLKANKLPAAVQSFETVIKTYPKFDLLETTYLYLGVAQLTMAQAGKAEMFDAAAQTFDTLIKKYPEGKQVAQALFHRGDCLYNRGKKQEAAALYAELVQKHPDDRLMADALYALGVTQEELGQPTEAGKSYDLFLSKFKDHALATEVIMRRGETLFAEGQYEPAAQWLVVAAGKPDFALADHATLRQAAALAQAKKFAEAAAVYASLPAKFPKSKHAAAAVLAGGKSFYLAGNFAEAAGLLAKAAAAGGESAPEAAHWLARSLLKQNKPAEAMAAVEKVLPAAGASTWAASLLMDQADAAYEMPDRRAASAALYAGVAVKYPKDPVAAQALYMAGFAALGAGDYAAAQKHAAAFLAAHSNHELTPDVTQVAAESALQLSQHAEAEKLFAQLLAKSPQHADAPSWHVRRALCLHLQKKYPDVVTSLQPAIAGIQNPDLLAEAQYLLGSSQLELKQFEPAIKALEASLAANPKWRQADDTLLALSHAYQQAGKADQAKTLMQKLVKDYTGSKVLDRGHYRLGEQAFAAADWKTAAAEYQLVVDKWPQSPLVPHALYGLGWAKLSQQDFAGAEKTFDAMLEKSSSHTLAPRARYARGLARQQLKKFPQAVEDVQSLLAANPTPTERSDARYVLGLCQVGLQQFEQAAATFQALLKDDPGYASADKVLYELAWAVKSQNKDNDAVTHFGQLAEKYPNSPLAIESQYHVGEALYKANDFKKAAAAYYAAMQKAGNTDLGEKAAHKLGWSYYRQDDLANAQQSFNYQRTAWPNGPLASDGAFMEGECLFKQNKFPEAVAAYQQVKTPSAKDFQVLTLLHHAQAIVQIKQSQPAAEAKQWQQSLDLLTKAVQQAPDTAYLPEILYEQGWALQNLGKLDEAVKVYEDVIAKTNREVAARAQFMIGEIQFQQKKHADAVKSFFKVSYGYGYPKWQADAAFEAGRCFEVLDKKEQAIKQYQELIDKFPQSDRVATAKQRLAELKK